ncbi:MAG: PLAT/LH2 domain-containing protein [Saprospiraceae bacterium]
MQRPFYTIAHHVNVPEQIQLAIDRGANALECDIDVRDGELVVRHPAPDLFSPGLIPTSVPLIPYLETLNNVARSDDRLALVFFDCKISDADFAREFMETIISNLIPSLNILVSVGSFEQQDFLLACIAVPVGPRVGFGIDAENDYLGVQNFFNTNGVTNAAYANGVLEFLPNGLAPNIASTVQEAVAEKALGNGLRFVFVWTLGKKSTLRHFLRAGVDGIFVNLDKLTKLGSLLEEEEFVPLIRLATREDNPFAETTLPAYVLTVKTKDKRHAGTDALLTFQLSGSEETVTRKFDSKLPKLFEKGDVNRVTLIGDDAGTLDCLTVSRNTGGNAPGWFLSEISVESTTVPVIDDSTFIFDSWIPRSGLTRCLGAASYRLEVRTANRFAAGTDAVVSFTIIGALGNVTHNISADGYRFERNTTHIVNFTGFNVGAISTLTVSHDGTGTGPDWHLYRVTITAPSGMVYNFIFDRDIEGGELVSVSI